MIYHDIIIVNAAHFVNRELEINGEFSEKLVLLNQKCRTEKQAVFAGMAKRVGFCNKRKTYAMAVFCNAV